MSRAGPECLSPGRAPGRHSYQPHRIMAAAILGQVGAWPTAAGGSGEPDGGRTSGRTTSVSLSGLASFLCALGFRCRTQRQMGPLQRSTRL